MHIGSVVYANQKYGAVNRCAPSAAEGLLPLERTHSRRAHRHSLQQRLDMAKRTPRVQTTAAEQALAKKTRQLEDTIQTLNVKVAKLANAWHAINAQQRQMTDELVALKQKNLTREAMEFINNLEGTIDGIDDCFLLEQNVLGWEEDL